MNKKRGKRIRKRMRRGNSLVLHGRESLLFIIVPFSLLERKSAGRPRRTESLLLFNYREEEEWEKKRLSTIKEEACFFCSEDRRNECFEKKIKKIVVFQKT